MRLIQEYGGFRLDKDEISKVFRLIVSNNKISKNELVMESGYGINKIDIIKDYYLKHLGLLTNDNEITKIGNIISEYDKYFIDEITLWIMIYHWSRKRNNPILYAILNHVELPVPRSSLKQLVEMWLHKEGFKTNYQKDYLSGLLSKTLNAFEDEDAFKSINLIRLIDDKYYRGITYKLNPLLLAYVLYENRNGRIKVSVEDLINEKGNIGAFVGFDLEKIMYYIYKMRDLDLLTYSQAANLNNIDLIYKGEPADLIKRYYESQT